MKKRYTVTFDPNLADIDAALGDLQACGVQIESAQKFIGTCVVEADEADIEQVKALDAVVGVAETGTLRGA